MIAKCVLLISVFLNGRLFLESIFKIISSGASIYDLESLFRCGFFATLDLGLFFLIRYLENIPSKDSI